MKMSLRFSLSTLDHSVNTNTKTGPYLNHFKSQKIWRKMYYKKRVAITDDSSLSGCPLLLRFKSNNSRITNLGIYSLNANKSLFIKGAQPTLPATRLLNTLILTLRTNIYHILSFNYRLYILYCLVFSAPISHGLGRHQPSYNSTHPQTSLKPFKPRRHRLWALWL